MLRHTALCVLRQRPQANKRPLHPQVSYVFRVSSFVKPATKGTLGNSSGWVVPALADVHASCERATTHCWEPRTAHRPLAQTPLRCPAGHLERGMELAPQRPDWLAAAVPPCLFIDSRGVTSASAMSSMEDHHFALLPSANIALPVFVDGISGSRDSLSSALRGERLKSARCNSRARVWSKCVSSFPLSHLCRLPRRACERKALSRALPYQSFQDSCNADRMLCPRLWCFKPLFVKSSPRRSKIYQSIPQQF